MITRSGSQRARGRGLSAIFPTGAELRVLERGRRGKTTFGLSALAGRGNEKINFRVDRQGGRVVSEKCVSEF